MKPHEQRLRGGTPPLGSLLALALFVDGRRRAASPGRAQPPFPPDLSYCWARCMKPLLGPARAVVGRGGGAGGSRGRIGLVVGAFIAICQALPPSVSKEAARRGAPAGSPAKVHGARGRGEKRPPPLPPGCANPTLPHLATCGWSGLARLGPRLEGGERLVSQGERFIMIPRPRGCVPGAGPRPQSPRLDPGRLGPGPKGAKERGGPGGRGRRRGKPRGALALQRSFFLSCW